MYTEMCQRRGVELRLICLRPSMISRVLSMTHVFISVPLFLLSRYPITLFVYVVLSLSMFSCAWKKHVAVTPPPALGREESCTRISAPPVASA